MDAYTIEFSGSDMQVLQAALVELPFRVSAPLINKINAQIQKAHDQAADQSDRASGTASEKDHYAGD